MTSGDEIVAAARVYLGQSYKFGGDPMSNPLRTDCSGLLIRVLSDCGITVTGRTTYDLVKEGTAVERADVAPGDAIFDVVVGHVGIYSGNGNWIEDPHTGSSVKEDPVWSWGQIRRFADAGTNASTAPQSTNAGTIHIPGIGDISIPGYSTVESVGNSLSALRTVAAHLINPQFWERIFLGGVAILVCIGAAVLIQRSMS